MAILATETPPRKGYTVVTSDKDGVKTEHFSAEEGDRMVAEAKAGETTTGKIATESAAAVLQDVGGTVGKVIDAGFDLSKILLFGLGLYLASEILGRRRAA